VPEIPEALDAIVMRGLSRDREQRFSSALEMAAALESLSMAATPREVGELLKSIAKEPLTALSGAVRAVEAMSVESEATLDTSSAVRAATLSSPGEMTTTQNALFTSDSGSGATHAPPPTPAPPQSPRRGALVGGMVGATVIVALIATAAVRYRTTPATIATPPVASSTPTSSMSSGPSAAAPEASTLALASAHVPDAPAATSATTPAPSASVALGAGGRKRPGSRPSTAASASAAPKADPCDPPYVIDEAGVRRVKRECIK
jgi:serine/threonine-protein kinase